MRNPGQAHWICAIACLAASAQTEFFYIGSPRHGSLDRPMASPAAATPGVGSPDRGRSPDSLDSVLRAASFENVVIVTLSNYGGWELLLNWHCSLVQASVAQHAVVFALDDQVYRACGEAGIRSVMATEFGIGSQQLTLGNLEGHKEHKTYCSLMRAKMATVERVLSLGFDVAYTDTDTVWLQNPLGRFAAAGRANPEIDAYFMFDGPNRSFSLRLCAGFFFMRSVPRSLQLLRRIIDSIDCSADAGVDDQHLLNELQFDSRLVMHAHLHPDEFVPGFSWSPDVLFPLDPAVVHAHWCRDMACKRRKLRDHLALWFVAQPSNECMSPTSSPLLRQQILDRWQHACGLAQGSLAAYSIPIPPLCKRLRDLGPSELDDMTYAELMALVWPSGRSDPLLKRALVASSAQGPGPEQPVAMFAMGTDAFQGGVRLRPTHHLRYSGLAVARLHQSYLEAAPSDWEAYVRLCSMEIVLDGRLQPEQLLALANRLHWLSAWTFAQVSATVVSADCIELTLFDETYAAMAANRPTLMNIFRFMQHEVSVLSQAIQNELGSLVHRIYYPRRNV
jgi:hypothetical protein